MNNFDLGIRISESVLKTQEALDKLHSAFSTVEKLQSMIRNYDISGVYTALSSYTSYMEMLFGNSSVNGGLLGLSELMTWLNGIQPPRVVDSIMPLINTTAFANIRDLSPIASALANVDWSWISNPPDEERVSEIDQLAADELTPEVRSEIGEDVNLVLANPVEAQGISQSTYEKWKQKNPLLADLFLMLVLPILATIIGGLILNGIEKWFAKTSRDTQMYSEPTSTAPVVQYVSIDQRVTVIGDVPYYHKVEFVNPTTGEVVEGYIYKGNLITDETDDETADETEKSANPVVVPTP